MVNKITVKTVSSLEKLLPGTECTAEPLASASALLGEEYSYQIAYIGNGNVDTLTAKVESDIADCVQLFAVHPVPVVLPHFPGICDDDYITHSPALIPDVLLPISDHVNVSAASWATLWVSVRVSDKARCGTHTVRVVFRSGGEIVAESELQLCVINAQLPQLDIPNTHWFYADCIATYHGCEIFSERHWELIGAYMRTARQHGINMILTPIFTPPLDTVVGAERPTVQLVGVTCDGKKYTFDFTLLGRWLDLARECGMEYIEISHLFTQWGAEHAPKIVVNEGGQSIKKFGWHTDSTGEDYLSFLDQLLPPLLEYLSARWDKSRVYFHISDEPGEAHMETYRKLYEFMAPRLLGFNKLDAIGSYTFYESGCVETPVVATSRIGDFLGRGIENLWCYFCCSQGHSNLANKFIAMPSVRTRIIGVEMYLENICGFLQWGYNFYYSRLSRRAVDPYLINDSDRGFPAGDAFLVYPTESGALPSVRLKVFASGLRDLMACRLLESLAGRETVERILLSRGKIALTGAPYRGEDLIAIREMINSEIKARIQE